jgi:hypothetical protein
MLQCSSPGLVDADGWWGTGSTSRVFGSGVGVRCFHVPNQQIDHRPFGAADRQGLVLNWALKARQRAREKRQEWAPVAAVRPAPAFLVSVF